MKEKNNVIRITENQEKEVKGGVPAITWCYNPEFMPRCRCKILTNKCAQVQLLYPACP